MIQKIVLFVILPIFILKYFSKKFSKFGVISKSSFLYGIGFGILGAFAIGITYYFLQDSIEWESIKESITSRGVNGVTFIFIFAYIMFGNSLIEEFFFRGIVFDSLLKYFKSFAYIFSSLLFSLYHFAIFGTWFQGYILLLAFVGLFLGGLFFSWLYKKTNGIWGAYIFHIIVDLVILVIGYNELFI
ncbi:hypothetical protein CSA08_03500 [Candidatus Gracilibacteria bacterium]|nr:MAG: hypothetical protein CSA08_03500 [Candidatus Gracilibacteria bacterium]